MVIIIPLTKDTYFNTILKSPNRQTVIKVELMYPNGEIFEEITSDISNTDGNLVNTFTNGQRRNISLTINNPIRKYGINPRRLWLNTYFRVYKGFYYLNNYIWFLQGTFILSNPVENSSFSEKTIQINGIDKMSLLDGTLSGNLEATYQVPANESLKNAIIAILNEAGDNSPLIYDVALEGIVVPYTISRNDSYYGILEELAELYSSNVYYNTEGCLCFISGVEQIDDSLKPSIYSFKKDGKDFNYLTNSVTYNFSDVKNYIKVVGATVNGEIFDATASDTNLESPVCIDFIGRKILYISDDNINSDQLAQDRANYELKKNRILFIDGSLTCPSLPHLDANCVIDITDEDLDFVQQRVLIQSISDSYAENGQMTVSYSNVNELPFSNT